MVLPTLLEVEHIENRYQLQSEGKSEYYGFDRALSIKRKVDVGFSLAEQLRDDPQFVNATIKELDKAIKDYERDYLLPLECAERYLRQFGREGMYSTISSGRSDREGRWQAFLDYSKAYQSSLRNPKWRAEHDVHEDNIGALEEAAFDIIRVRTLQGFPKVHQIMRHLPRYWADRTARKEMLRIADEVEPALTPEDCNDKAGVPLPLHDVDAKWALQAQQAVLHRLKKATDIIDAVEEKEGPLALLEAAVKKLSHPNLEVDKILVAEFPGAQTCRCCSGSRAGTRAAAVPQRKAGEGTASKALTCRLSLDSDALVVDDPEGILRGRHASQLAYWGFAFDTQRQRFVRAPGFPRDAPRRTLEYLERAGVEVSVSPEVDLALQREHDDRAQVAEAIVAGAAGQGRPCGGGAPAGIRRISERSRPSSLEGSPIQGGPSPTERGQRGKFLCPGKR